jgi:hypothetical protein
LEKLPANTGKGCLGAVALLVPLGLVQNQPTGKIKSLGKYLFSRHPKHTIGICSLRYIQIQGAQKIASSLQKLENPKSLIFFRKNALQHERTAVS